ncbi:FecR family protein [Gaoshiqia sp. Z1-71]|uniref:FecR family protein n=1 Tax=Gaoshiqia hydrogeniformans TaxID=3290090 RepID=UPI003BF80C27
MSTYSRNETDLFDGYLRGNLSKREETQLSDWINSSGENYRKFKAYVGNEEFTQPISENTALAWDKLKKRIKPQVRQERIQKIGIPGWLKIAALLVLAVLSGFYANYLVQEIQHTTAFNEVIVPYGEKAQIRLSDGTNVFLNSGTTLKYPTTFSKKTRQVFLAGEAFFEVAKDKKTPFIVEAPRFNVKVTGTSFNLNSYKEDAVNSLTLHSGAVTILAGSQEFEIRSGERFSYNMESERSDIHVADLQKSFLWSEDIIVIEDLNLGEIRKILERKFDVRIEIAGEMYKKIRYTGQFKPHEELQEILNLIKETAPVKFSFEIDNTKRLITIK